MVVLTDDEDNHCRLVSVRLLGAAGVEVPRPDEEPRPQLGYRREREKQRAAWRRGSMIRASSMPRLRVRAINWITFMTNYVLVTNLDFCILGDLDPPVRGRH